MKIVKCTKVVLNKNDWSKIGLAAGWEPSYEPSHPKYKPHHTSDPRGARDIITDDVVDEGYDSPHGVDVNGEHNFLVPDDSVIDARPQANLGASMSVPEFFFYSELKRIFMLRHEHFDKKVRDAALAKYRELGGDDAVNAGAGDVIENAKQMARDVAGEMLTSVAGSKWRLKMAKICCDDEYDVRRKQKDDRAGRRKRTIKDYDSGGRGNDRTLRKDRGLRHHRNLDVVKDWGDPGRPRYGRDFDIKERLGE
jgi:hypothetical protein